MPLELVNQLPYNHPYRWDGTLFGGPKLWRPTEITTALWLDAEDTSTITLNGATVSQWADKSGNGRNAVQATAANQPTYNATGLNSKPSLSFDGNDSLSGLWAAATASQATVAVVGTYGSSGTTQAMASIGIGSNNSGLGLGWNTMSAAFNTFLWAIGEATRSGFVATPLVHIGVLSPSSITQSLNGNTSSAAIGSTPTVATNYQVGGIGGTLLLQNGSRVSEVVILSSAASTDNRQRLEGYLAWKWGLQADLPVGHPYKNTPPIV
jgi:hypothetical protein